MIVEKRKPYGIGEALPLSGKLYGLLEVLYDYRGWSASDLTIKMKVRPERGLGADGMPLVTREELTTLVYQDGYSHGYQPPAYGEKELRHAVERLLRTPLSELMVSGRLRDHAYWHVTLGDAGLAILPFIPGGDTW